MHQYISKPIAELSAYENNPRTHSEKQINQIVASINEFGFTNPVLIDKDNRIIAGHGRVLAAKKMGMLDVPCLILEGLSRDQLRAYVIADNKLAENADWDKELLASEILELEDLDFDISLLGFQKEELLLITENIGVPDFEPLDVNTQPRLDKLSDLECPHCGKQFKKAEAKIISSIL